MVARGQFDDTPMSRRLETEGRLTSIEVSLNHQDKALEDIQTSLRTGFARVELAHIEIQGKLATQHDSLSSLLDTRKRQQAAIRWIVGVVTAVVVAAVLGLLKLRG